VLSWVNLALALLKFVNFVMSWAHDRELISEGQRQEAAKTALAIATKVRARNQILEMVNALSDADLDVQLRGLEPK
jgi:hypothetical protein